MKIAFVVTDLSNTRIGGISRVATEVAANLAEAGHEVTAYVLARSANERPVVHRGIRLRYVESFPSLNPDYPVIGFSRRAFAQLCRDAETQRYDVVQSFNLNAIAAIERTKQLRSLGIPMVVSNYETLGMDVRAKATEFFSMPSLKTLAQIVFESMLALIYERRYLRRARRIVTEDQNTRAALLRMGMDDQLIRLIPSGVEVEQAQRAAAPTIDVRQGKAGPVIGYLGRVDPRKGVQFLVASMASIRQMYPNAVLFLAGGSRHGYDEEIRRLIARHGLGDCVRVLGRVPGDMLPYYKLADVVVIPSLSEGIPITLGEAMAARVPVVITRLPGVVPFVKPADLVFWADIADSQSLAQAVIAALGDTTRVQRVERAFTFIKEYTWRAVAMRHLAVYEEVVGQK